MASTFENPCAAFKTDESLFEALKKRIRYAHECLYRKGLKLMLASLTKQGGDEEDIRDAFQEGIAEFCLKIDQFDRRAAVTTILYPYVHNRWIDILRKRKPTDPLLDHVKPINATPSPEDHLISDEMQQEVRMAIQQLDPRSQELVNLLFYEERSSEEAARERGIGVASVYNQKGRILKSLAKLLKR
jgi:RNA polymerase sigma-70 factor, ECF subfamily